MVAEKVKLPKRGIETPLPLRICFAMYWPNPFQIVVTVFSSNDYVWLFKNLEKQVRDSEGGILGYFPID